LISEDLNNKYISFKNYKMNKLVFDKIDKFNKTVLSRLQKSLGRQFLLKGLNLQGAYANDDVLVPSLRR
jgi:hypothetical protein